MKQLVKHMIICMAVLTFICTFTQIPVCAAPDTTTTTSKPQYSNKWKRDEKGFYYYYKKNGKKATNLTEIKDKTFYFDKKGIQRYGWQQIKGKYYYFAIARGSHAYMQKDTTVNEIRLDKDGSAILDTDRSREKVKLMCNAQKKVQEILTINNITMKEKLRVLYDWTQEKSNISKSNIGGFKSWNRDWDLYYAGLILNARSLPARGDCYTYACTFGYLANAIGYPATVCSSGGHGYTLINHRFYDPSWQKAVPSRSFFDMDYDTIAYGLGLRYRNNMKYTRTV